MRHSASFFGAALLCTLASFAPAQQTVPQPSQPRPAFQTGDAVDLYSFGTWIPCTVSAPASFGAYQLHCGKLDLQASADSHELRAHPVAPIVADAPMLGVSIGARYATRDPRTCEAHRATISSADARDLFICDAEHEFGGSLYLVSNVALDVASPRPYNPNLDAGKKGIDPSATVFDIHASYDNFQCSPIPSRLQDYPGTRNCNQFKMSNAAGGCFKNQAGEWHCLMYDFHPNATATATNVAPPTIVE